MLRQSMGPLLEQRPIAKARACRMGPASRRDGSQPSERAGAPRQSGLSNHALPTISYTTSGT